MYEIDQAPDEVFGNVQIQPWKFESLESGNDSVYINLSARARQVNKTLWISEPFLICWKLLLKDQQ